MHRIVLCGAGYGEAYRRVFRSIGAELVGVVGRGGVRSRSLASAMRVPWSRSLTHLLPRADLVIVAVGGADGDRLAMESLYRAVPVLREHPVSMGFAAHAARAAAAARVPWLVNPHFAYLRAPAALIARCHQLACTGPPSSVFIRTNVRMAFSAIDLLLRVARACRISPGRAMITRTSQSIRTTWRYAGGQLAIEISANFSVDDNEHDVMTGHLFRVTFAGTELQLASAAGPLIEIEGVSDAPPAVGAPLQSRMDFLQDREFANLMAVQAMLIGPPSRADQHREDVHVACTARIWNSILRTRC